MKKLLIVVSIFCSLVANAQEGRWKGELNVPGMKLPVVFNFSSEGCTMDSPSQGAVGIKTDWTRSENGDVKISIPTIGGSYEGRLEGKEIKGVFKQMGMSFPLNLIEARLNRPQTPVAPFPYTTEEVKFKNGDIELNGTLTLPAGFSKKTPVLVMVTGSGQQNRNEELFNHKPFLVIADYLARHGIASLRYDDRATGASVGGEVAKATTEDFMRDAAAGLRFLRSKKIFRKIGVLGHSEGGCIAFMLGAKRKGKGVESSIESTPDFIISLAGPGVKGDTLLVAQGNRILSLSGQPANMTIENYRQQQAVLQMPWLQWFINYDPSTDIRNTHCPVLALNGANDSQVISSLNLSAIRQLLPKSKKNFVKEYPELNHLFQHCTTGLPTEYGQIEETISPEVLQDIVEWIIDVSRK